MDADLTKKLENIRGFSIIKSEESQILVDISDFGMDMSSAAGTVSGSMRSS